MALRKAVTSAHALRFYQHITKFSAILFPKLQMFIHKMKIISDCAPFSIAVVVRASCVESPPHGYAEAYTRDAVPHHA